MLSSLIGLNTLHARGIVEPLPVSRPICNRSGVLLHLPNSHDRRAFVLARARTILVTPVGHQLPLWEGYACAHHVWHKLSWSQIVKEYVTFPMEPTVAELRRRARHGEEACI